MKKFLALLTAIFISFVSTSTVIACGKIEEKDNSGALKEALLEKFHQVVNVGYENYMQSKRENFLLAVSSTTSTGYRFINKEVMNTYYNKNTKNFNDSKEIELGKIIDDPIHLEYLNYDVTQRILDLDSMRMAIIDEIQKNTDAKLLGQFIGNVNIIKTLTIGPQPRIQIQEENKSNSKEETNLNYTITMNLIIDYEFLNLNDSPDSKKIEKELIINILTNGTIVTHINSSLANLSSQLFSTKEKNLLMSDKKIFENNINTINPVYSFDPKQQDIINYFGSDKTKKWLNGNIETILKNNGIGVTPVTSSTQIKDVSFIENHYQSSLSSTFSKFTINDDFTQYLLFRKKDELWISQRPTFIAALSDTIQKNIKQDAYQQKALKYFKDKGIKDVEYKDFDQSILYGAFNIDKIQVSFSNITLRLNPVQVLFSYAIDMSNEQGSIFSMLSRDIVESLDYIYYQNGITERKNSSQNLWTMSKSNENVIKWANDYLKPFSPNVLEGNEIQTTDVLKNLSQDMLDNINEDNTNINKFVFQNFSITSSSNWYKNAWIGDSYGIVLTKIYNQLSSIDISINLGPFTFKVNFKAGDVQFWTTEPSNGYLELIAFS